MTRARLRALLDTLAIVNVAALAACLVWAAAPAPALVQLDEVWLDTYTVAEGEALLLTDGCKQIDGARLSVSNGKAVVAIRWRRKGPAK